MPRLVNKTVRRTEGTDSPLSGGADREDVILQLTALRAEVKQLVSELLAVNARAADRQAVRT